MSADPVELRVQLGKVSVAYKVNRRYQLNEVNLTILDERKIVKRNNIEVER